MVDREIVYQAFYGGRPPPPPWATDCPIRFEVWLAFAEAIRFVTLKDAAAALGKTQAEVHKGLPSDDFPYARQIGATWRVPVTEIRKNGGSVAPGAETTVELVDHHRVDVILTVHDDFGVAWVLNRLRGPTPGLGRIDPVRANPIAAGGYIVVQLTFAELIQSVIPMTNLGRKIRTAQLLGSVELRADLGGDDVHLPPQGSEAPPSPLATPEQQQWEARQLEARHEEREAHLAWFLKLLATVAGPEPRALDALAALLMDTALSNPTDVPDVIAAKVIDRRRSYPIPSVTLNRDAHPAVSRSRITIKADAAEQLFAIDTSNITWAVVDSGIDMLHPAFAERDEANKPVLIGAGPMARSRVTRSFDLVGARSILSADVTDNGLVDWSRAIPYVEMQPPIGMSSVPSTTAPQNLPQRLWKQPQSPHGTHVAGILGADWPENGLRGICPRIRLFDVRVLGDKGQGDEFSIVAALQLIRHLNEQAGRLLVIVGCQSQPVRPSRRGQLLDWLDPRVRRE